MTLASFAPPVADTFLVDGVAVDASFGGAPFIVVGGDPIGIVLGNPVRHRGLLRFDVSGLPTGCVVSTAVLTLTNAFGAFAAPVTYLCSRVTENGWTEAAASWNHSDASRTWATPGGDFSDVNHDSVTIATPGDNLVFTNLAALVSDALQARGGQLCLLLRAVDEASETFITLRSGEVVSLGGDPSAVPTLIVTYSLPSLGGGGLAGGMQEFTAGT